MISKKLGHPCRNFCIFSQDTFIDPQDGRRKFVVTSFVSGGKGVGVIIDVESGEGEAIQLPSDEGAWGTLCWENEKLLFGTCANYGYLHCLDLRDRTWLPSLRDKKELYFWNLVLGSDNRIYGGTWPGGVLLRYDPKNHILKNLGPMSPYPGNNYTRPLYNGVEGKIFLTSGYERPHMVSYDILKEEYSKFGDDFFMIKDVNGIFVCGINEELKTLSFYDSRTLEKLEDDLYYENPDYSRVKNDHIRGYLKGFNPRGKQKHPNVYKPDWSGCDYRAEPEGQSYAVIYNDGRKVIRPIPTEAPPTTILTLAYDGKDKIWGSSGLGQTIFSYDINTGEYINTTEVCYGGGEVYGIVPLGDRIYMTSYSLGEHVVYYPDLPWDLGVNPKIIKTLYPEYIRPQTRSYLGYDGNIWTGWWADYGIYGGALTKIDVKTDEVTLYPSLIEGQCINHLVCTRNHVVYSTTGQGNGLPPREVPLWICGMDYGGCGVFRQEFPHVSQIGPMAYIQDKIYVRMDDEIVILNGDDLSLEGSFVLPKGDGEAYNAFLKYDENTLVVFHCKEAYFIDVPANTIRDKVEVEGTVMSAVKVGHGEIYYQVGPLLCKICR